MTFEILTNPATSPASLLFQQCLVEILPENRLTNIAKDEIGGYFLDRIESAPVSEDLWMKVLNNTNGTEKIKKNVNESLMSLLQELYDYEILQLDKVDFQKRKRVKNVVPLHDRCTAVRANGEQCSRRKKGELEFCGTHSKGTPYGIMEFNKLEISSEKKKEVWIQEIKGIQYFIDSEQNIYNHQHILSNERNPEIIGKCTINNMGNYEINNEFKTQ